MSTPSVVVTGDLWTKNRPSKRGFYWLCWPGHAPTVGQYRSVISDDWWMICHDCSVSTAALLADGYLFGPAIEIPKSLKESTGKCKYCGRDNLPASEMIASQPICQECY